MKNIFFYSDPHYSHEKCCTVFKREDGSPLRPFKNADEMDEVMIERFNKIVTNPNDVVYCLGDVAINRRGLKILPRLNKCRFRLVLGNHDIFDSKDYLKHFEILIGSTKVDNLFLNHVPIHPDSIPKWSVANAHGHIHDKLVYRINKYKQKVIDSRYINVSVEHLDYAPIELSELKAKIIKNQEDYPLDDIA